MEYTNTTLLCAKLYLRLGFSVIPIAYKNKKPLVAWEEFQRRKPTEDEVASWFARERRNVGIVCGAVSGNLCVLDFDSPEAYADFFPGHKDLEKTTMVARTRKGYHVYLRSVENTRSTKIPELKLELRSDGNYVVAPPSIHPEPDEDGGDVQYSFVNPNVENIALVDNVWQAVLKRATQLGVRLPSRKLESLPRDAMKELMLLGRPYRGPTPPCILKLLEGVPEGRRNDTCIKIASYFLAFCRLPPSKVLNILL
ncbi:MAG: bifunctional DNA primase/polymerase, partial [Candidatus Bathyarchaeia archaeon]